MQAATAINRFLIDLSSEIGLAGRQTQVSGIELLRRVIAFDISTRFTTTIELCNNLIPKLIAMAERAYYLRDNAALIEVSVVLMNLPDPSARQIGLYYRAAAMYRAGDLDSAKQVLEAVAAAGMGQYRARAIQGLGHIELTRGKLPEAKRLQLEAFRVVPNETPMDLQIALAGQIDICIIRSIDGDHEGALASFEDLTPVADHIAQHNPVLGCIHKNALAVEYVAAGRIGEAEAASLEALASPFATAYPEFTETRDEIAAAKAQQPSQAVVAISISVEPRPDPKPLPDADEKVASIPPGVSICLVRFRGPPSERSLRVLRSEVVPHKRLVQSLLKRTRPRGDPVPACSSTRTIL